MVRFLFSLSTMYDSSFEHSTISLSTLSHFYTSSFSRGSLHFPFSLSPLCHICIPLLFLGLFRGISQLANFVSPLSKFAAVFCYFSSLSFPFFFRSAVFSVFFSPLFLFFPFLFLSTNLQPFAGGTKEPPLFFFFYRTRYFLRTSFFFCVAVYFILL